MSAHFHGRGSCAAFTRRRSGRASTELSLSDRQDEAWFLAEDSAPVFTCARWPRWPASGVGTVREKTAVVKHDGPCMLVMRRAYYPGWVSRVNAGPKGRSSGLTAVSRRSSFSGRGPVAFCCATGQPG